MRNLFLASLLVLSLLLIGCGGDTDDNNTNGETGETNEGSKTIVIEGSSTVLPLANIWSQRYMELNEGVEITCSGGGSSHGIGQVIDGQVDIGNASRAAKPEEKQRAEDNGIQMVEHIVAYDGLAIIVHPNRTEIDSITVDQVREMFIKDGTPNWSVVGLADRDATIVSRDSNSGTYGFFKEFVLDDNDYFDGCVRAPSNQAQREAVAANEWAIGYLSMGYLNDSVRAIPVINDAGDAVMPSVENVVNGTYPIFRPLFMYTNGEPTGTLKEFMDWVKSVDGGQAMVREDGTYVPAQ